VSEAARAGSPGDGEARLAAEAVRLYRRYAVEIVEGLDFCPYAARARTEGRTLELVVGAATPSDAEVLEAIEQVAERPEIDIGLVLFPRMDIAPARFGPWVETLRKAHVRGRGGCATGRGDGAVLAIEGFHPRAEADVSRAERLTPFVRRTPDPTLQLTRLSALERVRRGTAQGTAFIDLADLDIAALLASTPPRPLHERIADANLATVLGLGVDEVRRRIDDIARDRDASYRAIDAAIAPRLEGD
jgi:hypothetical protein